MTESAIVKRRQSVFPDTSFDEAFAAFQAREKRRRSTFIKPDNTAVDTSATFMNIVITVAIIAIIVVIVVGGSAYIRWKY